MIYNVTQYLRNNISGITIYPGATFGEVPDDYILLQETGGEEGAFLRYATPTLQVITRSREITSSRKYAFDVFDLLHGKFGLILPAITVDGTLYSALETAQIKSIQKPYSLGANELGLYEYSTNYQIIFKED